MAVDLRLMRYVIAVADEGGFQRAAERLLMAQPPLSRQIRDLERELGVALFARRPVVRLTSAGEVFVAAARAILAETEHMVAQTVLAGRGELGTVRVGYVYSAVFDTLPLLVAAMAERHPGVTVDVHEGWTPQLDAALLADGYDVVLSRDIPRRPEYHRESLRREGLVAVVDERHPLALRGSAALREFAGQRFCHPPSRLAPDRYNLMAGMLARTGEVFEFSENPIHGLSPSEPAGPAQLRVGVGQRGRPGAGRHCDRHAHRRPTGIGVATGMAAGEHVDDPGDPAGHGPRTGLPRRLGQALTGLDSGDPSGP